MPYKLSLQLFADGSADSGVATGGESAGNLGSDGVATGGSGEQVATATGDQAGEESWDSLIKGKYKEQYGAAVKAAVDQRFKNQRNLQSQIDMVDPIIRGLAEKYGIQSNPDGSIPIEALNRAYMDDNSRYEEEAFEKGMRVEDLKRIKQLEAENQRLQYQNQYDAQRKTLDDMHQQGEALKQVYPTFDYDTEMQNPEFGKLAITLQQSGFPNSVRRAFEIIHQDDIMGGAMQYAVQQTAGKISRSVQSGMRRPQENGTSGQSTAKTGSVDPSKLSQAQIHELAQRAARGEKITFRG